MTFGTAGLIVLAGQLISRAVVNEIFRWRPGLVGMAVQTAVGQLGAMFIRVAGEAILA